MAARVNRTIKGGGMDPPPTELWQLIFLLRRFLTLLQLDNAGVGLIGDLGENQQVVPPEAVRRLPLPFRVAVALREGDVVAIRSPAWFSQIAALTVPIRTVAVGLWFAIGCSS